MNDTHNSPANLGHAQRYVLLAVGWFSVVLAMFAFIIPLIPSLPFLLLASVCFGKASPRFHNWLMNHRYLGPPLRDWNDHRIVRSETKLFATVCIVTSLIMTSVFLQMRLWIWLTLNVVFAGALVFIWSRPEKRTNQSIPS